MITGILIGAGVVIAAILCVWFFVIHKHVSTIHAKVDTILSHVSAPAPLRVQSTVIPSPQIAAVPSTPLIGKPGL